ncbi:MAG: hypothetical protein ACFFAG_07460 [Promethearchaeota archaeon]
MSRLGWLELLILDGPQNPHSGNCPYQGFMSIISQRYVLVEALPIMVGIRVVPFEGKVYARN